MNPPSPDQAGSQPADGALSGKADGSREWMKRVGGNGPGVRFFIWIIRHFGILPAYAFLFPAALQYVIFDKTSCQALRTFRNNAGLRTSCFNLFRHFFAFGMSLIDRYFFLLSDKQLFTYEIVREELISDEVKRGGGAILLGAHLGNWEIAGNLLGPRIGARVNFVMYEARPDGARAEHDPLSRRQAGVIPTGSNQTDTVVGIVQALRKGEIVCLHGDRILPGQRTMPVPFLGKPAPFPTGPFALALLAGAPIIPFFAIKTGLRRYRFEAFEPVRLSDIPREERQQAIEASLKLYVSRLEQEARRYPYQWYNFFDFWETA